MPLAVRQDQEMTYGTLIPGDTMMMLLGLVGASGALVESSASWEEGIWDACSAAARCSAAPPAASAAPNP